MFIRRNMSVGKSLGIDAAASALSIIAVMCVIKFLSPPLPLHDPWCATGWDDPSYLVAAGAALFGRWRLVKGLSRLPVAVLGARMEMMRVADALPELTKEIRQSLLAEGRTELADQFGDLTLSRWTSDPDRGALYVYLGGQRPLNVVEQNVIGTRHGECITVEDCEGTVVLDTDNFGRVTGIELLDRNDIRKKLEKLPAKP